MSANQPPPPPPPGGGGYGAPPPPPGGGGYGGPPPPPGGGYGGPPPGGGYGGYPGQPPAGDNWELGKAISYGWEKFQANMGQLIIAMLAIVVPVVIIAIIGFIVVGAITTGSTDCGYDSSLGYRTCDYDPGAGFFVSIILYAVVYFLIFLVLQLVGANIIRGCLGITEGRPFKASDAFKFQQVGPVLVTSLLLGVAVFIGFILCYIPGIIIAYATAFTMYFVVDKNMAPVEAIKASLNLVKNNLGSALVWLIVGGIIGSLGGIVCGIGLLFTYPIYLVGTAFTYKKLTGQPVAP